MTLQPRENMIAVLPHSLSHKDGRFRMDLREHIHTHALAVDEAVLESFIVRMSASQRETFGGKGGGELLFHLRLGRPADLVRRLAQIAARNEQNLALCDGLRLMNFRNYVRGRQVHSPGLDVLFGDEGQTSGRRHVTHTSEDELAEWQRSISVNPD